MRKWVVWYWKGLIHTLIWIRWGLWQAVWGLNATGVLVCWLKNQHANGALWVNQVLRLRILSYHTARPFIVKIDGVFATLRSKEFFHVLVYIRHQHDLLWIIRFYQSILCRNLWCHDPIHIIMASVGVAMILIMLLSMLKSLRIAHHKLAERCFGHIRAILRGRSQITAFSSTFPVACARCWPRINSASSVERLAISCRTILSLASYTLFHLSQLTHLCIMNASPNNRIKLSHMNILYREELFLKICHVIANKIVVELDWLLEILFTRVF